VDIVDRLNRNARLCLKTDISWISTLV
jgi:hypothetical protein